MFRTKPGCPSQQNLMKPLVYLRTNVNNFTEGWSSNRLKGHFAAVLWICTNFKCHIVIMIQYVCRKYEYGWWGWWQGWIIPVCPFWCRGWSDCANGRCCSTLDPNDLTPPAHQPLWFASLSASLSTSSSTSPSSCPCPPPFPPLPLPPPRPDLTLMI